MNTFSLVVTLLSVTSLTIMYKTYGLVPLIITGFGFVFFILSVIGYETNKIIERLNEKNDE